MTPARRFAAATAASVVVFAVLFAPWARMAATAIPVQPHADDARLLVWIVGWVARAIATAPAHVVDAPIDYPAPAQLTGCEHLATAQLVAGPVVWLTGNAVLAANAAAMAGYVAAAVAMERLATVLGAGALVAWTAGLFLALGPLRVPPDLQTLQYPAWVMPLAALGLVCLGRRPDARRTVLAAAAIGLGLFASYYAAVLVALVAVGWIVLDLRGRARVLGVVALAVPLAVLAVASRPYLARAATLAPVLEAVAQSVRDDAWMYRSELALLTAPRFGTLALALAAAGVLGVLRAGASRRLAVPGLVFALAGCVLMLGPSQPIGGHETPLPYALLAASPARVFRIPQRFVVLAGFGTALLAAAALAVLPRRAGAVAAAVAAALLLADRGAAVRTLGADPVLEPTARAVYARVARVGHPGPLLELPLENRNWASLEPDAMVGETIHHQPLAAGYTGYRAAHRPLFLALVRRLPEPDAWNALVDLTHVRWLLLRPAATWRNPEDRTRLVAQVGPVAFEDGGWTLVRVARIPERTWWFDAIADGLQPGRTVFGTPLAPIDQTRARLSVLDAPAQAASRNLVTVRVRVANQGDLTWPVAAPADFPDTFAVGLAAEWQSDAGPVSGAEPSQRVPLPWDVRPGEHVDVNVRVGTPAGAGAYRLTVRLTQQGSPAFDGVDPVTIPLVVVSG